MKLWTTYSPQKICWEVTNCLTEGKGGNSNWMSQIPLVKQNLKSLKKAGIVGIRLVLFPTDFTLNGKDFDFKPLETMLNLCKSEKMLVDFCLGPLQYPFYPSIRLPKEILNRFNTSQSVISSSILYRYGLNFLNVQLKHYAHDPRIRGWYVGNEWPDSGDVEGKQHLRVKIPKDFMLKCLKIVKRQSPKSIHLNTNIDACYPLRLRLTFGSLFSLLGKFGRLGFDVYPSQESWRKSPMLKLKRLFFPYPHSFMTIVREFSKQEMFFAEIEAQPWGDGRSWYQLIKAEADPKQKILLYTRDSLPKHMNDSLMHCDTTEISLWGADFWLSCEAMGITWPLEQVKTLSRSCAKK